MPSRDERRMLKAQEQEYKQQAKERQEELKQLNKERRQAARQRQKEDKKAVVSKNKKPQVTRMLLDVFPIRDYQNDYFTTDDNQIIDLFQVRGKSYYNASDDEINAMVEQLAAFFRLYKADLKFIGMNYPTNTKNQQAFLTFKMQQPGLERYEEIISSKLEALQYLEANTTDREAFVMIYAKNNNHYDSLCNLLNRSGLNITVIDREKKENILFQLNNMCKKVKI